MLVLAVDTSTSAIGVAVHDGSTVLASVHESNPMGHAELLAPAIERVVGDSACSGVPIDAVVVGRGPGPFTGLRVGVVTGSCLALAWGVPLHGVCSLDALAQQVWGEGLLSEGEVLVASDARRREVYWATYRIGAQGIVQTSSPQVGKASDIPTSVASLPQVGRGAQTYLQSQGEHLGVLDVDAGWLASRAVDLLAQGADLSDTSPLYLRRPDAAEQPSRSVIPLELRVG